MKLSAHSVRRLFIREKTLELDQTQNVTHISTMILLLNMTCDCNELGLRIDKFHETITYGGVVNYQATI